MRSGWWLASSGGEGLAVQVPAGVPGFGELGGGQLPLKIPHNVFSAWMVSPLPDVAGQSGYGSRPVDHLGNTRQLLDALAAFADKYRPVEKGR